MSVCMHFYVLYLSMLSQKINIKPFKCIKVSCNNNIKESKLYAYNGLLRIN